MVKVLLHGSNIFTKRLLHSINTLMKLLLQGVEVLFHFLLQGTNILVKFLLQGTDVLLHFLLKIPNARTGFSRGFLTRLNGSILQLTKFILYILLQLFQSLRDGSGAIVTRKLGFTLHCCQLGFNFLFECCKLNTKIVSTLVYQAIYQFRVFLSPVITL